MTVPPITDLGNFRVIVEGWYRHFQDASEDERGSCFREPEGSRVRSGD